VNIDPYQHGDEFAVSDLVAKFEFKSASSISFGLGRYLDELLGRPAPPRSVFDQIGWLDVHHPCEGHIKVQLRVCLPIEYLSPEQMRTIVQSTLANLGIPSDETYDAYFVSPLEQTRIDQPRDRDRRSNRLYS
jgi:hypothetical protein